MVGMHPEIDYIVDNIKQEPEATFLLILPPARPEIPLDEIKVERNSAKISVKLIKFDQGRRTKARLFQTYRKCEKCDLMITDRQFKIHNEKCKGNQKFECDLCGKFLKTKGILFQHMRIHAKGFSFVCGKCGKGFKTKGHLVQHQKQNNRIFKCLVCDKEFECENLKHRHMKEVHKEDLKCPKCQFTAKDYKNLQVHHYMVHDKHHSCETCSKKFPIPSALKNHQLQHKHGIYKDSSITFDCDQCKKSFSTSTYLKKHQKNHHGKEKFQCDFCSKIFVSRAQLFSHMLIHIKVPCHICKKAVTKNNFKAHLKSHSERSYKCDKCKKSYSSRPGLRYHVLKNHQ